MEYKYTETYNSIVEFAEHIKALDKKGNSSKCPRELVSKETGRGPEWAPQEFKDCLNSALQGGVFEKGSNALKQVSIDSDAPDAGSKKGLVNSVVGFMPNVPAYLSGNPLNMLNAVRVDNPKRFVKIGVHPGISCATSATQRLNFGRALLTVLDALALQNYSTEIWLAGLWDAGSASVRHLNQRIRVKAPEEYWSIDSAAFSLCNASFTRRLLFRSWECVDDSAVIVNNSYGRGVGLVPPESDDYDVFFEYFHGAIADNCRTEKGALAMVCEYFKEQAGIVINP